jgi:hypothetical protein
VISQLGGRKLVATVTLTQTLNTALKNQNFQKLVQMLQNLAHNLKKMESRVFKEFVLNAANFEPNKGIHKNKLKKIEKLFRRLKKLKSEIAEQKAINLLQRLKRR